MKKTSRQLQKEHTKELLLKTAYEVFSERGIMNTRMSDIAQAGGVSHGTMFVHFQTQEALIEEVVGTYAQKIALRTHELAQSCESVEAILRAHLSGIMEFEPFYRRLVIESPLLPTGARDCMVMIQSAVSLHFSSAMQRREKTAEEGDVSVSILFNMWIGLIHYYLVNNDLFAPDGHVIERWGETLLQNFLKLLPKAALS